MAKPAPANEEESAVFAADHLATDNIYQRMHKVMQAVNYVAKEKKDGMKYSIVSHDKVTALLRDHIVGHGIHYAPVSIDAVRHGSNMTSCNVIVRFTNIDTPEDAIDVACYGEGIDPGDKAGGKAQSYAVKYALLKAFGLETGDDPDFDQNTTFRTSLQDKADRLAGEIGKCTDALELRALIMDPAVKAVVDSLKERSPSDAQLINVAFVTNAKRLGTTVRQLMADPAIDTTGRLEED